MKKGAFIIVYFGCFNNYFQLFLNSCGENKNYDWLIFTDDKRKFDYPQNVRVHYTTFNDIKSLIERKFSFKVALERPYKLCDYKVAYGYLFEEYLTGYKMWGHCDNDLIFGFIDDFIQDWMIDEYDKIGMYGHFTLYRNTYDNNRLFMSKLDGINRYEQVFKKYWYQSFDEEFKKSINNIFEKHNKKVCYEEFQANIYTKSSDLKLVTLNEDRKTYSVEKLKKGFFIWDHGHLKRIIYDNDKLIVKKYMYIHLQARPMNIHLKDMYANIIKIIPNSFDDLEVKKITCNNFAEVKLKYFNLHYFKLRGKNLLKKIKRSVLAEKWRN